MKDVLCHKQFYTLVLTNLFCRVIKPTSAMTAYVSTSTTLLQTDKAQSVLQGAF